MADDSLQRTLDLAALPAKAIPAGARMMARLSLFDWLVVARAGSNEPLSRIIRDFVRGEEGRPVASVAGGGRVPTRAAALANGTISHALDYDDTHFAHVGHPSVAIMPAALAVAEEVGASAADMIDAFLVGAEASVRLGMALGRAHYQRGFHQTATAGAFGAAVAAGRLYGLAPAAMREAIGLVSTRASGLKSQFGTMGKPFNAGIAASNGVEAAALARSGFTSCDDGFSGPQGFLATHSDAPDPEAAWRQPPPGTFIFEDVKYKLHACCHGTHAMLEAIAGVLAQQPVAATSVASIDLRVNPRWLAVCNIQAPRTGLEVKFSYAWLAAMAFRGINTASDAAYTDELCSDPGLADFAARVRVSGVASISDTATEGRILLANGTSLTLYHDLAATLPEATLKAALYNKARGLIGREVADRLRAAVEGIAALNAHAFGDLIRE